MKQSKPLLMAGLVAASVAGGALFTGAVSAQASKDGTGLADAIAIKFNLKSEDVQSVIKEYRVQHKAEIEQEMQAKLSERLDQAVTDGKITAEQKELIIAKMDEVKTKMQEIRDMTDKEARKSAMQALHSDLKAWAETNDIPEDLVGPKLGHGPGDKMRIRFGGPERGDMPDDSSNTN